MTTAAVPNRPAAPRPIPATAPPPAAKTALGKAKAPGADPIPAASTSSVLAPAPTPVEAAPGSAITQPLPIIPIGPVSQDSTAQASPPVPTPLTPNAADPEPPPRVAKRESSRPSSTAQQSSPSVLGYAIAYTPKDGPGTPAVVIAPEAQSSPQHEQPQSTTVRSTIRRAPVDSAPLVAQAAADLEFSVPKKRAGRVIAAGLGVLLVLLLGVIALRATRSSPPAPPVGDPLAAQTPAFTATPSVMPAAELSHSTATALARTPEPVQAPEPTQAPDAEQAAAQAAPPESVPAVPEPAKVRRDRAKADSVVAGAARPKARPAAAPVPPAPTSPKPGPAKSTSGKGVIVRDSPF